MNKGFFKESITLLIMIIAVSCSTNESCADLGSCPNTYLERTDIQISGQLDIWDNQIIENGNIATGPVGFNYYGNPSDRFDFVIDLESGYTLIIRMNNRIAPNPQDDVAVSYSAYPSWTRTPQLLKNINTRGDAASAPRHFITFAFPWMSIVSSKSQVGVIG